MPESPKACWSCGAARAPTDALCPSCGKVQPPPQPEGVVDRFAVMGLPRSYELDERALEETFRSLSRKLHPDRFARATPRERRFSLEQTTLLNDAYRTLRDPVRRAEQLLALRGVKVAGEERGGAAVMPQEFLEQALEDREKLLEAKSEGGPEAVARLAEGVRGKRHEAMDEIARLLRQERPSDAQLQQAGQLLARLRYYARYLDEVEGRAAEI
ncbi:MAG TPA: Fe-S protein assembly co-chaperone HscB [Myxococcales bacterium]|nr:Fe-S protein assembly co-chaperone HscB [Myxococcales bacterium]